MNAIPLALLAVLSVWDYPARQPRHDELRSQFVVAVKEGDTETMAETCRKGVELLPDDPTWQYNLACSLAYFKDPEPALDALERAIDLGFRDADAIASDRDLKRIAAKPRFKELVEHAREIRNKPILVGPLAVVPATGIAGESIALGAQNLAWDLEAGCFDAKMRLAAASDGPYVNMLYVNRDARHSMLAVTNYPGLTSVVLDREGRERGFGLDFPDTLYPYPVFGNCSRAMVSGPLWRSLPRALMTNESRRMKTMHRLYLSNQLWVFPTVDDYSFGATNSHGDVFASVSPYWIATQGRSWSDQYYLKAALSAVGAMHPSVKDEIVKRRLLAPTLQALIRKSLKGVGGEDGYLTSKAHPTAFPPNGLDLAKLKKSAAALRADSIPPVALISGVGGQPVLEPSKLPELTYIAPCSWAFVLRSPDVQRSFVIRAAGGAEFAFAAVHDEKGAAKVSKVGRDAARVTIDREKMSVTNRVDVAVFAKNARSGWGAPSFVSFAVVDADAPYSDPVLTPPPEPVEE